MIFKSIFVSLWALKKTIWSAITNPKGLRAMVRPSTFEEAVEGILFFVDKFNTKEKQLIQSLKTPEKFSTVFRSVTKRHFIDRWKLNDKESILYQDLHTRFGLWHQDDMASTIFMCAFQKMNKVEMTPEIYAESYRQYWESKQRELGSGDNGQIIELSMEELQRRFEGK